MVKLSASLREWTNCMPVPKSASEGSHQYIVGPDQGSALVGGATALVSMFKWVSRGTLIALIALLATAGAQPWWIAQEHWPDLSVEYWDSWPVTLPDDTVWHALWSGNVGDSPEFGQPAFLSVIEAPYGRAPVAKAEVTEQIYAHGTFGFWIVGWEDGNGDGYPEFIWISSDYGTGAGGITVNVLDVHNRLRLTASWGFITTEPTPQPIKIEFRGETREQQARLDLVAERYLYAWIAALTAYPGGWLQFNPRDSDAEGPSHARVSDVQLDPRNLCGGYAVYLGYRPPSRPGSDAICDLMQARTAVQEVLQEMVVQMGILETSPDQSNVVKVYSVMRAAQEDAEAFAGLRERLTEIPPWQREAFRDWVVTESQDLAQLTDLLVSRFLSIDYSYRWEADKFDARRECRVEQAPTWCEVARKHGYLD